MWVALYNTPPFSRTTLRPLYGPQNETKRLLSCRFGWQKYGPKCVVALLLVAPSSDWFWCGQVKDLRLFGRNASRQTPLLHSFGLPCGESSHAVPFAAAPLVCAGPLVVPHRAYTRPLTAGCRPHARHRLAGAFHAFVLSRYMPWAPTHRVWRWWLSWPHQQARCQQYPWPGQHSACGQW